MDMFSCPHCKQEIEEEILKEESVVPGKCPHCGKMFSVDNEEKEGKQNPSMPPAETALSPEAQRAGKQISILNKATLLFFVFPFIHLWGWGLIAGRVNNELLAFIFILGFYTPVLGVITGHTAWYKLWRYPQNRDIKKETIKWLSLNYVYLIVIGLLVWGALELLYDEYTSVCRVKISHITSYFERDDPDYYPQLLSEKRHLVFANKTEEMEVYTKRDLINTFDPFLLFCPLDYRGAQIISHWERSGKNKTLRENLDPQTVINQSSYMYLGYVVTNDTEMRAFAEAYKKRIALGLPFDCDLEVPPGTGTGGSDKILRLQPQEKMMITFKKLGLHPEDAKDIPVMWDRCLLAPGQNKPELFHYHSPSISVLYLDRSAETIKIRDKKWPLTEETMRLFWELEHL